MKHKIFKFVLLVLSLTLSACASNPSGKPGYYFSLAYQGDSSLVAEPRFPFIKIDLPNFSSKHNTEAIVYTRREHELDRYSQSEWKEPLPALLQEWLLQSLEHSNLFAGVMRGTSRAKVPLFMESDIIKFQHNVTRQVVELSLRLTLLDYKSRKILKHKIFNYHYKVSDASAKGAVYSFNQALKELDRDIYQWLSS